MKTRADKHPLPPEEWDFRRCPENERATCHHYEYAREFVWARPELAEKLAGGYRPPAYNHFLKFIFSDKVHPDSLPMRCTGFPDAPWLSLPPKERTLMIAQCRLLPEKNEANSNLLVEDEFDVAYLQELDERREELFLKWMKDNRDQNDRQIEGLAKGVHMEEDSIERPMQCSGPRRYYAVVEQTALAVIRLDWQKSDRELTAAFARLLGRRPKSMMRRKNKPSRGGRGGVSDQLKALGAMRLRTYYGSIETALEVIQSAYSDTRNKPPYTDANGLQKASLKAEKALERLEHDGRFRAFLDF